MPILPVTNWIGWTNRPMRLQCLGSGLVRLFAGGLGCNESGYEHRSIPGG